VSVVTFLRYCSRILRGLRKPTVRYLVVCSDWNRIPAGGSHVALTLTYVCRNQVVHYQKSSLLELKWRWLNAAEQHGIALCGSVHDWTPGVREKTLKNDVMTIQEKGVSVCVCMYTCVCVHDTHSASIWYSLHIPHVLLSTAFVLMKFITCVWWTLCDSNVPSRCKCDPYSSGMSRSVDW
jgi:hypothetical protein